MQHDETRWRCLVACAYPCRPDDSFPLIRHREFFGASRIRLTLRGDRTRQFVPPPDAWLHEPYAGNAGLAGPFHRPHYLTNSHVFRRRLRLSVFLSNKCLVLD